MVSQGIPERFANMFANAANGSRKMATWKQRKSVMNVVNRCREDLGELLTFPWAKQELHNFVGWCMEHNLKSSTIEQYVSNVRSLHKEMGLKMDDSNWQFLSNIIKGHGNLSEHKAGRIPMTPELMYKLKWRLGKSHMDIRLKRLIWATCTILFQGSFRIGEILSSSTTRFCPDSALLGRNVTMKSTRVGGQHVDTLFFVLRKPKETKGNTNVTVEIFDLGPNCFYNGISAWYKWRESSTLNIVDDLPIFRKEDGSLFTPSQLNTIIQNLLKEEISYMEGTLASHSFRSGVVTIMGRLGYSEDEIKRQGRWTSEAFRAYLKLGRAVRLEEQYNLASRIANLINSDGVLQQL